MRHQLLDGAGDVFDRDLRVDAMLIEEIDAVGAKTLEHALDRELDVVRAAVEAAAPRARLRIDVPAELGGDDHLVPEWRDAFAQDPLDLMWAVSLGGVEERDATVEGCPDDVEHLGPAGDRRLVGAAHVLDAEADARDFQRPQLSPRGRVGGGTAGACCLGSGLRVRAAEQRHRRETARCPQEPTTPRFEPALFSHVSSSSLAVRSPVLTPLRTAMPRCDSAASSGSWSDRFPDSVAFCVTSSRAFRGSGPAPAEPSGRKSKIWSLLGVVARPGRQTRTVRVAGLGEVDPIALRHPGDRQILGRRRAAPACRQRAEHIGDLAAVRGPRPHLFPHRGLNVGEPVQIDRRTVGREGIRGKARRLGLAEVVIGPRHQRGQVGRSVRIVGRLRLGAPLAVPANNSSLVVALTRLPAVSALLLPSINGTRGWRRAL